MKSLTIFMGLFLMTLTAQSQKVITVDNRPNTGPDVANVHYSSLSDAVAAATLGDTIQIHPSATSYGNTGQILKTLHFVGLSHNPANSKTGEKAIVSNINFRGSCPGSTVSGLEFAVISVNSPVDIKDIKINNNRITNNISGITSTALQDWIIEGNIFITAYVNPTINVNGWKIKNNIFDNTTQNAIINCNDQTAFLNNLVISSSGNFVSACTDTMVSNNIFILEGSANEVKLTNSTIEFSNNLTRNVNGQMVTLLTGNNNLDNIDPGFTFAFADIADYYNNDYNVFDIGQPTNPKGAGTDGTDVGVFGAMFNFDAQGRPDDYPYMTSLDITNPTVPMGQMINVTFTAEKKN